MALVRTCFAYVILSFCFISVAYGQRDTTFLSAAQKKMVFFYTESIRNQSRLYNGSDYVIYIPDNDEHPYFQKDDWATGSVVYEHQLYEDVALLYDVAEDQLITEHNRGNAIKLVAEKVQRFKMFDHTFVRLAPDANNKIPGGFYDELYSGKLMVYAKHFKHYDETLNSRAVIPRFDERVRYYLVKDGNFNLVKSKHSVIQILGDRKQEVQSFIRKSNIRFKSNRSQAIVRIAEFYDTLNP